MLQGECRIWLKSFTNQWIKKNHFIFSFSSISASSSCNPLPSPLRQPGPLLTHPKGLRLHNPLPCHRFHIFLALSWQILHILLGPPFLFSSVYSMPISDTTQLSPRQSCHRNGSTSNTNTHPRNTDGGKKQTIKHQHQKGLKFPVLDQKYLLFGGILP